MAYHLLLLCVLAQGLSGLAGGIGLMTDPSGTSVGLPIAWLQGTPFADYFLPGLILFSVLGIGPLVAAWGLWARRTWALMSAVLVGAALVIWILVEILMIGYQADPPLQAIYGVLGLLILYLASTRSVRDRMAA